MPLPEALEGKTWMQKTARTILPVLVWRAKNGRTITYSELDQLIVSRGWGHHVMYVQYGHPAGAVGDALLETEKQWEIPIPPLNALIVNVNTGIPGRGCDYYLKHFLGKKKKLLSAADRKALAEATHEKIFNFTKWDKLIKQYGLKYLSKEPAKLDFKEASKPLHGGWSLEGESKAHEMLKVFVAHNPSILDLDLKLPKGNCEYVLASADRPDVIFEGKDILVVVEVKSRISNDADLQRGIFQCVKYRALIRAEQKSRQEVPNGIAVLVTQRHLPLTHKKLAELLDVPVVIVEHEGRA